MSPNNRPLVICVGAQKAGTSWLYKCLEEHRDICAADGKETNFFLYPRNKELQKYLDLFKHCRDKSHYFEASPLYLYDKSVAHSIFEYSPSTKIIVILRNPVERTISHYHHLQNNETIDDSIRLETAIERWPELIKYSQYKKHIKIYTEQFPPSNILFIDFEDIKKRPQYVMDTVCRFCGVNTFTPRFLRKKYNSSAARSNRFYGTMTMVYLKLKGNFFGKKLLYILRCLNVRSDSLENLLSKTSRKKSYIHESEVQLIRDSLVDELEFYKSLEYGN